MRASSFRIFHLPTSNFIAKTHCFDFAATNRTSAEAFEPRLDTAIVEGVFAWLQRRNQLRAVAGLGRQVIQADGTILGLHCDKRGLGS